MKDPRSSLRLVYVTLEKAIKSKLFVSILEALDDAQRLDRFVVDEAHCASSWVLIFVKRSKAFNPSQALSRRSYPCGDGYCNTTSVPQRV